jgi:hypothetical protein
MDVSFQLHALATVSRYMLNGKLCGRFGLWTGDMFPCDSNVAVMLTAISVAFMLTISLAIMLTELSA